MLFFFTAAYSLSAVPVDLLHCEFNRTPESEISYSGNPVKVSRTSGGWHLTFPKIGRTEAFQLPHSYWKRPRPEAVVLRAEALKGRAFVKMNLVDGNGRFFTPPGRWIEPGSDRIVFSVDGMEQGNGSCRFMTLQIDPESPGTELLLKRIDVVFDRPDSEAIQLTLDPGGAWSPLFEEKPKFILRNGTAQPVRRQTQFTFTALDGAIYTISSAVNLAAYSEMKFEPENPPPHPGVWYGRPETDTQRLMFSCMPENGLDSVGNPEFEFAVDNHWINPAVIEAMRFMGIRAVRTIVGWERIQPNSADDWNFPVFDARLEALEKAGIKMRETLVFTPRWAATDNPENRPYPRNRKPKMEAWENYVRAMFAHYGTRVEYFEIWNEPDLTGFVDFPVEDYIELCRAARRIAREVNPEIKIASGGFATLNPAIWGAAHSRFHETVLQQAADTFDIHSYHEHGYFPHYQRMVDNYFLPLRKRCNITQPWLASETAIHSAQGTDRAQADCLFKKLLFTWARGGFSYTWYGLCNNGYDLNYSEDNFGIFDRFMNPKYIFGVYTALIRDYREAKFLRQISAENNPWLFAFQTPGQLLLANWNKDAADSLLLYAARGNGSTANKLDLEGNASKLPAANGVALFPVGASGATLAWSGATQIDEVFPVAEIQLPVAIFRNQSSDGVLLLRNPWQKRIHYEVAPRMINGMKISGLPQSGELAPDQKLSLPFQLTCDEAGELNQLQLDIDFDHLGALTAAVPLQPAAALPDAQFQRRKPDFKLNSRTQLEGKFEFDPTVAATLWQGADDLSADIWLGRNGDHLELRAEVRDDRHCPPPQNNPSVWLGDSVQFAFGFPGQNGYFELGGGLDAAGKPVTACWIAPDRFQPAAIGQALSAEIERRNDRTVYSFSIPLKALGVTETTLRDGFRFNILVNDNDDGNDRKCFLRLAPGIGSNQTMEHSPMVVCR